MSKVIVHIDLNAFFVRAEEIKNPALENKAVAIGHLGRGGVVSTCSYEARKFGVRSAMPMNKAVKLCPQLIIIKPDYRFYVMMSHQFRKFVSKYTKLIEMASIDELFADFTDVIKKEKDVEAFFKHLQLSLYQETGLKCSIGVGPTRFLAKMGSDYKKPMGLTIIRRKDIPNILYPLPIGDMFGVGKKTAPRLEFYKIKTIGDLAEAFKRKDQKVYDLLGKFSDELEKWIKGYGSDQIYLESEDPKSIGNSTTLKEDTNNYETIRATFEMLATEVSERAKKEHRIGNTIQIMVKDTDYQAHNKSITFNNKTNEMKEIYNQAIKLYEKNFLDMTVRAVGLTLQNLTDVQEMKVQMTFFDYEKHEEESETKLLINELNRKLNGKPLKRASEVKGHGNKRRD